MLPIIHIDKITAEEMIKTRADKADAIITMLSDKENYDLCEIAYEKFGTRDLIVRLHERENFDMFHKLKAIIVEPSTAMVSLLDHVVRSPVATSLILGNEEHQDTIGVELRNPELDGIAVRDLRFPEDIIVVSISRKGHVIISHGYTRIYLGDWITLVGSEKSLEKIMTWFESDTPDGEFRIVY